MTAREGPSADTGSRVRARWRAAPVPEGRPPAAALPAKLRPPQARVRLVERSALLHALAGAASPLVVLCAPAGAGKTTVLRQWAEADARPFAWVQLDDADRDPVVLLTYLAMALESVTEVDPSVRASLSLAVPPVRERILPLLGEALAAAPGFVLVLDDAHLLKGDKPWEVVAFILRGLPEGAQLAIGSRIDPALPLARMRAAGEVAEFRAAALSLDPGEVAELMRLHDCEADQETVDAVFTATEGWATGLQLACLARAGRPPGEWLPEIRGGRREIAEFLTSEVLDAQPSEVQEFLLRTSVLHELTPRLCALVTGSDDGGELLARVSREELFVVPLGDDGSPLSLPPPLRRDAPGRARPAASRPARRAAPGGRGVVRARGRPGRGDPAPARREGDHRGRRPRRRGVAGHVEPGPGRDGAALARRLHRPPDPEPPALTLTAGWVYTALDAGRLGERWCEAACTLPMDDSPSPDGAASLRSSQALLRATVGADGVRHMREDAELAAKLESAPGTSWYADAQVALGVARWLSGATQRALHPLAVGAREGSVCNPSAELGALGYLALIAADEAEWDVAAEYEGRATDLLTALGFGTHRRCLPMLLTRVRLRARGSGAEAAEAAADVSRLLRHMVSHPWMVLLSDVVLGEAAIDRADGAAAGRHAVAAAAQLERYPDAGILRRRAERLLEAVERTRLSEPLTPAERRVLELLPTHLTDAQMAEQLFVSRNTVKTHVKSLYRKLEVSSRAEAVARAREVGLLPRE